MTEIFIPEQGVEPIVGVEKIVTFLDKELAFYQRHSGLLGESLRFGNNGLNSSSRILREAVNILSQLKRSADNNEFNQLPDYVESCKSLSFIVGIGVIGRKIDLLAEQGNRDAAHWLFRIYSSRFSDSDPWIEPFRAIALSQPANSAFSDLNLARTAQQRSAEALERSERTEQKLSNFVDQKTELIVTLENLYRKKLPVEAPAITWEKIAAEKRIIWGWWLSLFGVLILSPICFIIWKWTTFSESIVHISAGSNGTISFAGLAAISVPALFYAWLLKNISRIFIQNLTLADDAAHRKALAITYLGLAENEKIQILDTERALILNALFRPLPPNSNDDGPPAGLLELLRK